MSGDCPYPGLRPFRSDEADIFFGREEQTDELLKQLDKNRFLAVVGPSGCGKSSLVRAGMIAALETGFMARAGARWRFVEMRPGSHPMQRLAVSLIDRGGLSRNGCGRDDALGFLHGALWRGPLGLVEALQETPLPESTNLLVLVDQFEEIFRFRKEGHSDEADAFVSLLLESTKREEVPIYVVITMRSDFLGDCALFTSLPEALNDSQFLTPRLTREQRRAAIRGPARVYGGDVEPELVNRLLNEMSADPDQLPIMQHLLMRMWSQARAPAARSDSTTVGADSDAECLLTVRMYEELGGLQEALSRHADEAFGTLDAKQQSIGKILLRRLSEQSPDQRHIRHPTPVEEIAALARVSVEKVIEVVDVFREPECSFIVPAFPEEIYPDTVLDISHESLIRQWARLKEWANEESQSAETYRFLEQTAKRWELGQAALWGTPNLELALDWKARERPTALWAERYRGDFSKAMEFLDASEQARRVEDEQQKATQAGEIRRLRRLAISVSLAFVAFACAVVFVLDGWWWPHVAYYNTFIKRGGKVEGFGRPLTEEQVRHRAVSLKFSKRGRYSKEVERFEAVDANLECTSRHGIGTYLEYAPLIASQTRECAWEFVYDGNERVVYEKAYNKFEELVWGLAYVPGSENQSARTGDRLVRQAYFIGPNGFPQPRKNTRAAVIKLEYDSRTGDEVQLTYWDLEEHSQPGPDRAFGQEREYLPNGLLRRMTSLDAMGRSMNDSVGNASLRMKYDDDGNVIEAIAFDKDEKPVLVIDGYHRWTNVYDDRGNQVAGAFFDLDGKPILIKDGYHRWTSEFNDSGNAIVGAYLGTDSKPTLHKDGYHRWTTEYDDRGNAIAGAFFDTEGKPTLHKDGYHRWTTSKYDDRGNAIAGAYFGTDSKPTLHKDGYHRWTNLYDDRGNTIAGTYFDTEGKPTLHKDGYHRWTTAEYDDRGNAIAGAYFGTNGKPTLHKDGYHRWTIQYNEWGNQVAGAYFDAAGQPILIKDGYHRWTNAYNDRGNAIAGAYFDTEGMPAWHKDGYHRWTTEYNDRDNAIAGAYFDAAGQPILIKDGYHRWTNKYDDRDNAIAGAFFDTEGKPTLHKDGYHRWTTTKYDDRGNAIAGAYFDTEGKPAWYKDGYHRWTNVYNERGKVIEGAFFDTDGKPALNNDGYHRWTNEYDDHGNATAAAYFGTEGQPTLVGYGYHRWTNEYDDRGNMIRAAYFDTDDRPTTYGEDYHFSTHVYDDRGNATSGAFFDTEGKPTLLKDGYHRWTNEYDDRGNAVAGAVFNIEGKPTLLKDGYHRWTNEYDDRGNAVAGAYFGTDGKPTLLKNDYHRWTKKYDDRGNAIAGAYFDIEGKPTLLKDGYHRWTNEYDERGNAIAGAFFDSDGQLLWNW